MGLLDGKKALIFGVANDHSIAWGIARALHEAGAEIGFSSVESLIDKRVRPLAESIGSTFVEPCDVQSDADIARVFARWGETHDRVDILVHVVGGSDAPPRATDTLGAGASGASPQAGRWTGTGSPGRCVFARHNPARRLPELLASQLL